MKSTSRVLPLTKWSAKAYFSLERKPLIVLFLSLILIGIGDGLIVLAELGSAPWTVLAQGVALQNGISIGWASFFISCAVMLMWIPLKLKLGQGTLLNIIVIALALGTTTHYYPPPATLWAKFIFLCLGILLFGMGSAFYLTCHQGAGPRDGLMVGLCQRFHWKIGIVRTLMESTVCLAGFLLGGTLGIGTLVFAFSIGWVIQFTLNSIIYFHQQRK